MKRKGFFMMMLGLGISFSVQAESPFLTLSQIEGIVLVNQGKQFARAHNGMILREGDRVLTMKESQVALRSEEYGCASRLSENRLFTIPENLDCETLTRSKTVKQRYAALGDKAVAPSSGSPPASQGGSAAMGGTTGGGAAAVSGGGISATTSLIVGGALIAAGAAGAGIVASGVATTSKASPD